MPRVLITGQTGFVGHWMTKKIPPGVEFVGGGRDFYNSGIMEHLNAITHIVHLAHVAPFDVIELAQRWGARLLYCSSGIVYHPENDTRYRHEKVQWENVCRASGVDVVIARLFTFFGAGLDANKAIVQFRQAAQERRPLKVWRGVTRSYMHGAELGRQMWRVLFQGESGRAYDIGSKRPVSLERLAKRYQAFTGCEIQYIDGQVPMPYYVPRGENGIMDGD